MGPPMAPSSLVSLAQGSHGRARPRLLLSMGVGPHPLPPPKVQVAVQQPWTPRLGNAGTRALSGLGGAAPLPALSLPNSVPLLQASSSSLSMAPLQYSPSSPSASHGAAPLILHPRNAAAELAPPPLAAQPLGETPLFLQAPASSLLPLRVCQVLGIMSREMCCCSTL
ncbi:uncharacterized protein [Zea mays]|uniref:Uncharacterized protein n=1 Tax=Zea mays TaxID=4577 RepID=C0HHQ6_MAIZE|nr:uncharacterized protein LOC118476022 [Zea mays]XP_035819935.1 uncharacterized protein LOC118476022 [Zea mays]XP_035819936.1 uncharacterized protein LOC118476022 [Zea mays]ACN26559.1 unknown [Zea mays]|eukprot:NP_001167927.1 uncharacterized protein LOC100381641 [Zea mays]